MTDKRCVACGREGSRGFVESGEGLVCASSSACDERRERARQAVGLHRSEWVNRNGKAMHSYKLDGKRVPGVTTIIDGSVPKPFLIDWAARVTARYAADNLDTLWGMRHLGADKIYAVLESEPRAVRDDAGERGSRLHLMAEDLMHGREVKGITSELLPWVVSVRDFIEDYRPRPVLLEGAVASRRWGYAGTLDLVADFPAVEVGGRMYPAGRRIVDYKSGRRVYSEVALQMGAYRNAEFYVRSSGGEELPLADLGIEEEGFAVHIRPEGYGVHPVFVGEDTLQAFARLKWLREFIKREGTLDSWLGERLPAVTERQTA